jgi:GNAT superfamily N-acetyltransferase
MSQLVVVPVKNRRQRRQFLTFPWTLYRNDPQWIPPLRSEQKELVGYGHHPFYEKNEAQTFVAYRDGEPCGRIAAILNRAHIECHNDPRGFFGFFECVDDQEVADGLFDAASRWLGEHNVRSLRGPANPDMNNVLGMLVEGFDSPPTFMMAYNPNYYPRLMENYGFRKAQDLYAYYANIDMLEGAAKHGRIAEQIVERFGVHVRLLNRKRFRRDVLEFLSIYNSSMASSWGFVPMSDREVRHMAKGMQYLLVPELAAGAEIDGKLVGVALALLDYNPLIRQIDGRLFPFGFLKLLTGRRQIKKVRLLAANVIPEYQLMGIAVVLLRAMVPNGLAWGLEEVEYSWVMESNSLSRGSLEKGGAERIKTYRLYDLDR